MRDGFVAVVVALALLAGCAASSPEPIMNDSPPLPPSAIKTGEGIYMVPIVKDADGCMQYRMHVPGKATVQVIYYADGKGGFTTNRAEADCPPVKTPGSGR